jgi:hypothetical protein
MDTVRLEDGVADMCDGGHGLMGCVVVYIFFKCNGKGDVVVDFRIWCIPDKQVYKFYRK